LHTVSAEGTLLQQVFSSPATEPAATWCLIPLLLLLLLLQLMLLMFCIYHFQDCVLTAPHQRARP
jgi:hypothetical protein